MKANRLNRIHYGSFPKCKQEENEKKRKGISTRESHTLGTDIENNVNFLVIARWVGHSSTRMIEQVYAQLRDTFKENEMSKIKLNLTNGSRNDDDGDKRS